MDAMRLESLLAATTRLGASALHLVPGRSPMLRVQRRFVVGDDGAVTAAEVADFTRDLMFSDHRERLERRGHVEVLYVARSGERYRATIALVGGTTSVVLRPVPATPPRLAELDLPPQIEDFTRCRRGLVAIGGFFGSGKSLTLAAIVDACNRDGARHVVSIEDSIQVVHQSHGALLHQREVGTHVTTAAAGVRQAMATAADVIVVSELGDCAALDAALTAAESGCLVFAGVESGSIPGVLADMSSLA
ncbi:MAG TPA: hypothetical protein ENI87_13530, partial [bacterium]|nr:hypothetical protein [bacterium]